MARNFNVQAPQYVTDFGFTPPWEDLKQSMIFNDSAVAQSIDNAKLLKDIDVKYIQNNVADKELADKLIKDYQNQADTLVGEIVKDPLQWRNYTGQIGNLSNRIKTDLTSGNLSRIKSSYNNLIQMNNSADKMVKEGKLTSDEAELLKSYYLKSWNENNPQGSQSRVFDYETFAERPDIIALQKHFKDMNVDITQDVNGSIYFTKENKFLSPAEISKSLSGTLKYTFNSWINQQTKARNPGFYDLENNTPLPLNIQVDATNKELVGKELEDALALQEQKKVEVTNLEKDYNKRVAIFNDRIRAGFFKTPQERDAERQKLLDEESKLNQVREDYIVSQVRPALNPRHTLSNLFSGIVPYADFNQEKYTDTGIRLQELKGKQEKERLGMSIGSNEKMHTQDMFIETSKVRSGITGNTLNGEEISRKLREYVEGNIAPARVDVPVIFTPSSDYKEVEAQAKNNPASYNILQDVKRKHVEEIPIMKEKSAYSVATQQGLEELDNQGIEVTETTLGYAAGKAILQDKKTLTKEEFDAKYPGLNRYIEKVFNPPPGIPVFSSSSNRGGMPVREESADEKERKQIKQISSFLKHKKDISKIEDALEKTAKEVSQATLTTTETPIRPLSVGLVVAENQLVPSQYMGTKDGKEMSTEEIAEAKSKASVIHPYVGGNSGEVTGYRLEIPGEPDIYLRSKSYNPQYKQVQYESIVPYVTKGASGGYALQNNDFSNYIRKISEKKGVEHLSLPNTVLTTMDIDFSNLKNIKTIIDINGLKIENSFNTVDSLTQFLYTNFPELMKIGEAATMRVADSYSGSAKTNVKLSK